MTKNEILAGFDGMKKVIEDDLGLKTCFTHHDIHMKNLVYDDKSGTTMVLSR